VEVERPAVVTPVEEVEPAMVSYVVVQCTEVRMQRNAWAGDKSVGEGMVEGCREEHIGSYSKAG
jgi:hypothetical protein